MLRFASSLAAAAAVLFTSALAAAAPPPAHAPMRALFAYDLEVQTFADISSSAPTNCDVEGQYLAMATCDVSASLEWRGASGTQVTIPFQKVIYKHMLVADRPWTEYRYEGTRTLTVPGVSGAEISTPVVFTLTYYDDEPGRVWGSLELKEFGARHWHRAVARP